MIKSRITISAVVALLVGSIVALADTTTTNFGWTKPTVNASSNTWGTSLDANYDALDATLGAVLSATGNKLTPTQLVSTGNAVSSAAWTTGGLRAKWAAATLTDTTSSGTVAAVYADAHKAATFAASAATTFTDAYTTYFEDPVAGTNATLTNKWALGAGSAKINGALSVTGHATLEGVTSTGATGTGNVVFSASPSITGTLTAANVVSTTGSASVTQGSASTLLSLNASGTWIVRGTYGSNQGASVVVEVTDLYAAILSQATGSGSGGTYSITGNSTAPVLAVNVPGVGTVTYSYRATRLN